MPHHVVVEFIHADERFRAEVAYDRVRHQERYCGDCGRSDLEVTVSVQVVRVCQGGQEVLPDGPQFSILAAAAEHAFKASPLYGEALADAGPL